MQIYRKIVQILILLLFILGNFKILNILSGDLSSSKIIGFNFLFDPLCALQMFLAGISLSIEVIFGSLLVLMLYGLLLPRGFCAWVCPVGLVCEISYFLRKKLQIKDDILKISPNTKYFILFGVLLISLLFGFLAFERLNLIAIFTRSIVFLMPSFFGIFFVILIFDLYFSRICVNLCPLGAFYALIGKKALIKVNYDLEICTACNKCLDVCPQINALSLIKRESGLVGDECISCGKCIDSCEFDALKFDIRNLRIKNEKDI